MSLADASRPSLLPFLPPKKPHPAPPRPFDEALISRLKSLLPIDESQPSITFAWLARAADLLARTLADAEAILSDPAVSGSDKAALAAHLDASVALLDACNAASAEIDRLLRHRLLLRLAIHLLPSGAVHKARGYITEWEEASSKSPAARSATDLIKSMKPADPPRGKISAVRRAIYAVEAVSCLVAGSIAAALVGETIDPWEIRVSREFPWSEAYNEVVSAVSACLRAGSAKEMKAVEAYARKLGAAMDNAAGGEDEGAAERMRTAAEGAVEALTEGLELLAGAVDGMFRAALGSRNAALQCFRVAPQKCK